MLSNFNYMYLSPENELAIVKENCKQQGLDSNFLSEIDAGLISLLASMNSQICFGTGCITLKEIINLPISKIEVLLSSNALYTYIMGKKASQLLAHNSTTEDIVLLISDVARTAYKNHSIDIEMLSKQNFNEKVSTLLKIAYGDSPYIDKLLQITDIDQKKLLLSDTTYSCLQNGLITLEKLIQSPTEEEMRDNINQSYQSTQSYQLSGVHLDLENEAPSQIKEE